MKKTPLKRKPMRRSQPRRDWSDARAKVEREGMCRNCGYDGEGVEAAHVTGRVHDRPRRDGLTVLWVNPDSVIPLCRTIFSNTIWGGCHPRYDAHELDILPLLTADEKRQALADLDYDVFAYLFRLTGRRFVPKEEEAA